MTLRLTPETLCSAYDFLRATQPFNRWGLPEGKDVTFKVMQTKRKLGDYSRLKRTKDHIIRISEAKNGYLGTLFCTMAHEMVHLKLGHDGADTGGEHSAEFCRLANIVCKHHGFDPKDF